MGSYHGAETCELIGLYLLHQLQDTLIPGQYGLYRDDGLAIIKDTNPSQLERLSKAIRKIFKSNGFDITIETGLKQTDFLDVKIDLNSDFYRPYRKPNSEILYVNKNSNHPGHITKEIPHMVNKRLQELSKNNNAFDLQREDYQAALDRSGYKHQLKYNKTENRSKKKKTRKRKIIYFQPPFCKSVTTKVGKLFLNIVKTTFTKDHPLNKILNPNSIKVSYCCLPNVKQAITSHNKRILEKENTTAITSSKTCNCSKKEQCPIDNQCKEENVVYQATIKSDEDDKTYVGSTGNSFKTRHAQHKHTFKNENANQTALSKYIWELKNKNKIYKIKWNIIYKTKKPTVILKGCTLCNLERLAIAKADKNKSLNKRSELKTQCPHYKTKFFKTKKPNRKK